MCVWVCVCLQHSERVWGCKRPRCRHPCVIHMLHFYGDFHWLRFSISHKDSERGRRNWSKEVFVPAGYLIKAWSITAKIDNDVTTLFNRAITCFWGSPTLNKLPFPHKSLCTTYFNADLLHLLYQTSSLVSTEWVVHLQIGQSEWLFQELKQVTVY